MESFEPYPITEIEQSIPDRFEAQVAKYGKRLAVKTSEEQLNYESLNRFANRIACALLKQKETGTAPIALLGDQSIPFIAACLGVLKAGMVYAPLDPDASISELTPVLESLKSKIILCDNRNEDLAKELIQPEETFLSVEKLGLSLSTENPDVLIAPDSPAYIYFTSGSTGRPKGVMDTHRNVLHNIMRYTNSLRISPDDKLTLLHSPNFSACVSSQFGALLNGACVFPRRTRAEDLDTLPDWLLSEGITIYHSVPLAFRFAVNESSRNSSLRLIRLEGDETSIGDLNIFNTFCPSGCTLVNGFGTTETGICRQYFYQKNSTLPEDRVPIGYSVEGMEVFVHNDKGNSTGFPKEGEICVRSRYLSPGYWIDPVRTGEVFSEEADGLRVWKTGDLGKLHEDGCLEFLGRRLAVSKNQGHNSKETHSPSSDAVPFIEPKTATEIRLASMWVDLLNCDRIGIADDFFELQGDSVKAIQLVNQLNSELKVRFSVRDVFNHPVLEDMARLVDSQKKD